MAVSKEEILETIAGMTVMEVVDLISAMEQKFGVSAVAAVAADPAVAAVQQGFGPSLAAFIVLAFFGPYFETRYLSLVLWLLLALATVCGEAGAEETQGDL